jgi:DNA-binding transcriptional LysR family regulator
MSRDSRLDSFCKGVLADLVTFQTAAKCGNRTDAAAMCGISPQAIGKLLKRLEVRLRGFTDVTYPLFDPSPKVDLVLTPYGNLLFRFAKEILATSDCISQ